MPSPDALRQEIATARDALRQAITAAADGWNTAPADTNAEGEAAWSARKAAKHIIGAEVFFAAAICEACGYPGPASPWGEGKIAADSADEASRTFDAAVAAADAKIQHVSETDLAQTHERFGTVTETMTLWASHLRDHAAQIRTAAGA